MAKKPAPKKPFAAIIAVVAVVGLAVIGYVVSRPRDVATVDPNLPPMEAKGILRGNVDAPVQVIEFADFECPGCGYFATITEPDVVTRLIETGQIAFRFYDYPLPMHKNSWDAHNAAACANEQGKFWEIHDMIFQGQDKWNEAATRSPKKVFERYVEALALDKAKWNECFDSKRLYPQIEANKREAERRGISQTPTFIIGDKVIPGAISYDDFKRYVDEAKVKAVTSPKPTASTGPTKLAPVTPY